MNIGKQLCATLTGGFAALLLAGAASAAGVDTHALKAAIDDPARPAEQKARDRYRHPQQTLAFFGIAPQMTVV